MLFNILSVRRYLNRNRQFQLSIHPCNSDGKLKQDITIIIRDMEKRIRLTHQQTRYYR